MDRDAARSIDRVPHGSNDDPDLLDFSANANPVVPDGTGAVYEGALDDARHYPPEPPTEFSTAAAKYVDCDSRYIVPTHGGMEAIRLAISLAVDPGDSILVPAPSFGEYEREVRLQGGTPIHRNHRDILGSDPGPHSLAIVCHPNNPTGEAYRREELLGFADRCRERETTLLVDEAFLDFTDQSSLGPGDGVVVARSLTKMFGLPGLRTGFAIARGELRDALLGARPPWNVSTPAMRVGTYCMRQTGFVSDTRARVTRERSRLRSALAGTYEIAPSEAPFLLLDVGNRDVDALVDHVRAEGIVVRDATTFRGLDSHIRVAVRMPDENDRLIEVLRDV